jgi:hypothetical protein
VASPHLPTTDLLNFWIASAAPGLFPAYAEERTKPAVASLAWYPSYGST